MTEVTISTQENGWVRPGYYTLMALALGLLMIGIPPATAHAHTETPHTVSAICATSGDQTAIRSEPLWIHPDPRAGDFVSPGRQLEQFVAYQIKVAWRDAGGTWQYRYGNWVAGRNGNFTADTGNSFVRLNGGWREATVKRIDTMFFTSNSGYSAQSIVSYLPGPREYWVIARYFYFPLNVVDTTHRVISRASDGQAPHWSTRWVSLTCSQNEWTSRLYSTKIYLD